MNYGDPAAALQAITGNSASDFNINPTNIAAAWNAGQLIVIGTTSPESSYIVGGHDYAVVGYKSSSSDPLEVFNPWGTDAASATASSPGWTPGGSGTTYGLFWGSAAFISNNFNYQGVGAGAINTNDVTEAASALTGPAAVGDGSATSGAIHFGRQAPAGAWWTSR